MNWAGAALCLCVYGTGWSNGFGTGLKRAGDLLRFEILAKHWVQHHEVGQEGHAPPKHGMVCWWVLLSVPLPHQLLLALRFRSEGQRRAVSPCTKSLALMDK